MNSEQLTAAVRTLVDVSQVFEELKTRALGIYGPDAVAARGYITPSEETQLRHLQIAYWKARNALFELMMETWLSAERLDRATPEQFLIGVTAAAILVDAARFLREQFHRVGVVRRKLDEQDPIFGIPPRMYDNIQKSLTSPYHAWHLWQAARYYDRIHDELQHRAAELNIEQLVGIVDRLRHRLKPSAWAYLRTCLRVRGRRATRHIGRDVLGRALYAVQEAVGRGLAEIRMKPSHSPSLPRKIREELVALLQPGDILVVRKEFAATNYFLPGHWPHVALYLGTVRDLEARGISEHPHVKPRLAQLRSATPTMAVLSPDLANAYEHRGQHSPADSSSVGHPCVLEAMKDGVRIRSVNSAFNSDSIVVLRPLLSAEDISTGLAQAFAHEGKPYDFDFDFCASHRMVCTEVVYRTYEGIAGVEFALRKHAGRFALSAGDLLRLGLARQWFHIVAAFVPEYSPHIQDSKNAVALVAERENHAFALAEG